MKKKLFPLLVLFFFSFCFLFLPSFFQESQIIQKVSLNTRDIFFQIRHLSSPIPNDTKDILIVTIDEESCQKLEARWPWSRHLFAELVERLHSYGSGVIGLNVAFTGLEDGKEDSSQHLAIDRKSGVEGKRG